MTPEQYTDPPEQSYGGSQDTSPGRAADPLAGDRFAEMPRGYISFTEIPPEDALIDGVPARDIDWARYHEYQRYKAQMDRSERRAED